MDSSKFLGKVIGIYLIIVSIAMLINMHQIIHSLHGLINDAPLMLVVGFFSLIPGILMVVSHNIWQWNWRLIITIISWSTLIKGASIIMFPNALGQISQHFLQNTHTYCIEAVFDLIIGILLCYFGFKRE